MNINKTTNPKVSVVLLTYNQDQYIERSLESALSQKTDFEYEILVGDDCSTDLTSKKLVRYRNIENIKIIINEKNIGLNNNLVNIFTQCRGEYIAMLEGDDYWHSDKKLQTQAQTLDDNMNCSVSCHDIRVVNSEDQLIKKNQSHDGNVKIYTLEDILNFNMIKNCSVMYRNGLVNDFPDWFMQAISCDWPLHVFHAQKGNVAYISENLATKRVHSTSLYAAKGREYDLKHQEDFFEKMRRYLPSKYSNLIARKKLDVDYSLFSFYYEQNMIKEAKNYFKKIIFRPISKLQLAYVFKSTLKFLKVFEFSRNIFTKTPRKN